MKSKNIENEKLFIRNIEMNENIKDVTDICTIKYDGKRNQEILYASFSFIINSVYFNNLCEFP